MADSVNVLSEIASHGVVRAAINLGNILLVTGSAENGDPLGVSPDTARMVAESLGVDVQYVAFKTPGEVADAAGKDIWDIALIAYEEKRAETIAFSPAYVEIEATYLVPARSTATSIADLDTPGTRIAISARSAYDLYLSRTLKHATLCRAEGLAGAFGLFVSEDLDALAGLRPALLDNARDVGGSRVIDGSYTSVRQAIGVVPEHQAAAAHINTLVRHARSDGTIQSSIDRHGVTGRLHVGTDG